MHHGVVYLGWYLRLQDCILLSTGLNTQSTDIPFSICGTQSCHSLNCTQQGNPSPPRGTTFHRTHEHIHLCSCFSSSPKSYYMYHEMLGFCLCINLVLQYHCDDASSSSHFHTWSSCRPPGGTRDRALYITVRCEKTTLKESWPFCGSHFRHAVFFTSST
jgi:hypothetical protein